METVVAQFPSGSREMAVEKRSMGDQCEVERGVQRVTHPWRPLEREPPPWGTKGGKDQTPTKGLVNQRSKRMKRQIVKGNKKGNVLDA